MRWKRTLRAGSIPALLAIVTLVFAACDLEEKQPVQMGGSIQGNPLSLSAAVTTIAGTGGAGPGSADGMGATASFYAPHDVTTDGEYLYVADTFSHTIRKIDIATREVTTLAGAPGQGGSTDGIGAAARVREPFGITTDGTNLYVVDRWYGTIRKVVIATREVTTQVGGFWSPVSVTTDGTNLYVADTSNQQICKVVIATREVTTFAVSAGGINFRYPRGITTDGTNLYVVDTDNHRICKIEIATKQSTTLAGTTGVSGSADGTGTAAQFNTPWGITTDGTNLYVGEWVNNTVRKIVIATGEVTTLAGSAGVAGYTDNTGAAASFSKPFGVTTDGTSLFVADDGNHIISRID